MHELPNAKGNILPSLIQGPEMNAGPVQSSAVALAVSGPNLVENLPSLIGTLIYFVASSFSCYLSSLSIAMDMQKVHRSF